MTTRVTHFYAALLFLFASGGGHASPVAVRQPEWTLIAGFDYAHGDYGQPAQTTIQSSPVTVKLDTTEWTFKFQTSYLEIEQEQLLLLPDGGSAVNGTRKFSGAGDTLVSIAKKSYFKYRGVNFFNVGIKTKIPTASEEKQLGTGETDWMLELDGFRSFGKWLPFASIGYRWFGDSDQQPRDDGVFGSLGLHYGHNNRWSFGALADYRSANSARIEDGQEFIPYLQYRLNTHIAVTAYGVVGLSDSSADRGAGVQLVYR